MRIKKMPRPKNKARAKEWREKISNTLKGRRCCMTTEFAKGHLPWNKGTKGLMKANKTSFKKGNIPQNYRGGIKYCKDGIYVRVGKEKYSYQKDGKQIISGKYEPLARKKYRETFGELDKNSVIYYKDGDVFNVNIENLELITRAELLKRNRNKNQTKKDCSICGKEFSARTNYCKTCSKECYYENCKLLNREYQKRWRAKRKQERVLINSNTYTRLQ